LFGIRANNVKPISKNRGFPEGVRSFDIDMYQHGSYVGHTWANEKETTLVFNEIGKANMDTNGWRFIFQSMQSLAGIYGLENVRLVVCFDNYG
jgi:hypothetical protein